jgi:predicted ATP-dependent serine protease
MGFWNTGIGPIDEVVEIPDGGLAVIYAMSGAGKTSLMLAMANSIKKAVKPTVRVIYFTLEMMHWAIYRRTKFLRNFDENDRIVVGGTMDMLEDYCDQDTVIFLDYADLLQYPGVSEVNQKVNAVYEELRRLSLRCKGIITASQIRKSDTEITLHSGLNSSAKAHYPDIVWSLRKDDEGGYTEVAVLKNRFGKSGTKRMVRFNYETLDIQDIGMVNLNEIDEEYNDL